MSIEDIAGDYARGVTPVPIPNTVVSAEAQICGLIIRKLDRDGGIYTEEATPVPIPNTVVKLLKVDGTIVAMLWESR